MRVWRRPAPWLGAGLAAALALAACEGRVAVPGVVTARLVSPNGDEGALYASLVGSGILGVSALDGQTFSHVRGDTVSVVVVRGAPGELRFAVEVADVTRLPGVTVLEVADGDNRLRSDTHLYAVELLR